MVAVARALELEELRPVGLQRTRTGYYYIAHYHPLRAMEAVDPEVSRGVIESLAGASFETYLHFPFCEVRCSFCHFYKELTGPDLDRREREVVEALAQEVQLYRAMLGRIPARSFYIGGGTPSVMSNRRLRWLLETVLPLLEVEPGAERKFELYPKIYRPDELDEKLEILSDFGFTDIVVDLESGNQASLNYVGRRNTSLDAYLRLVDRCVAKGFSSIVTALIAGLPFETYESLARTVETILGIPEVRVVNTFPLIIRRPDTIHRQMLRRPEIFPNAGTRDALWILARDLFRAGGFTEGPISYLRRPGKRPQQQADKFECVNLLGFGPSGFGYLNGPDWAAQYFNLCSLPEYFARIRAGDPAVWRLGRMDQEERARRKLIFGLANCKTEPLPALETAYGISVDAVFGQTLNALLALGLIELDYAEQGVRYTERGLCRLEEISYFLGSQFVKDRCAEPVAPQPFRRQLLSHHYYIRIACGDRARFEHFAATQPQFFMERLRHQDR